MHHHPVDMVFMKDTGYCTLTNFQSSAPLTFFCELYTCQPERLSPRVLKYSPTTITLHLSTFRLFHLLFKSYNLAVPLSPLFPCMLPPIYESSLSPKPTIRLGNCKEVQRRSEQQLLPDPTRQPKRRRISDGISWSKRQNSSRTSHWCKL